MLKRLLLLMVSVGVIMPQQLLALRAGDMAKELKIDYIANGPVELLSNNNSSDNAQKLKILVITRAEGASAQGVLPHISELNSIYKNAEFVVVTSDPINKANEFFKSMPNVKFATARDRTGADVRTYMAGSMIYPMAFVINYKGEILWNGETLDLPEMLDDFYAGTFDVDKAKKLAPLQDELQSRMRSGEERLADYTLRQILAIDPYNSAALRLRLFMLESSHKVVVAWNLIAAQLQKYPKQAKFYLMQLDFAMRYSEFNDQIGALVYMYLKNIPANGSNDSTLAWTLLTRMPMDATALKAAGKLLARTKPNGKSIKDAEILSSLALYSSRTGKLKSAIDYQTQAITILKELAPHRLPTANQLLEFYKTANL